MDLLVLLIAVLAGIGLGLLLAASRTGALRSSLHHAQVALASASAAESDLSLRQRNLDALVEPVREQLGRVEAQLRAAETERARVLGELREQVSTVREGSDRVGRGAAALVDALRRPQARGRWGELQLRRVVEYAGMVDRCDFDEQASVRGPDGEVLRPDLLVRLAGGRTIAVDAKVTLAAYLEAVEEPDEAAAAGRMAAHARHLREHVDRLADKRYWASCGSPEFVVLFVPGEAFLAPALEHDPSLLEHAYARRVHIATPTTLVSLLRTVGYAWQQQALSDNARAVLDAGKELYARLGTLGGHVDKLGRSLNRAVLDYNAALGSMERTLLPSARRLAELGVVEEALTLPDPLEEVTRPVTSPHLVA